MSMKQQILEAMEHESTVVKHLLTLVPAGGLEYRPSAGQRSMLDLQRYLTYCANIGTTGALTGNWDHAPAMQETAAALPPDAIAGAMDTQLAALAAVLEPITDDDLRDRDTALPWGTGVKLGRALLMMGPQVLTAYRMQLFLYIKAAGVDSIGSSDCWVGVSRPPEAATN